MHCTSYLDEKLPELAGFLRAEAAEDVGSVIVDHLERFRKMEVLQDRRVVVGYRQAVLHLVFYSMILKYS